MGTFCGQVLKLKSHCQGTKTDILDKNMVSENRAMPLKLLGVKFLLPCFFFPLVKQSSTCLL